MTTATADGANAATTTTTAMATMAPLSTPASQQQAPQASSLQRLNTGDRTNAVRLVAMADRSLAGPVASLFVGAALGGGGGGGLGGGGMASRRNAGNGSGSGSADASPTHNSGGNGGVRFTTTRTEDAMDSVLPTAAEDLLSRAVLAPAARFAPHKLSFEMGRK